ncbi:MAG: molecular chaperone TorD family protein [Candidatus Solibacter sp.]
MLDTASTLEVIAGLLEYPTVGYHAQLDGAAAAIARTDAAAAQHVQAFADAVRGLGLSEMEELYIQTFDLNPDACLDIGWHLFGEDYARGEFLVKLREEMRRYGIVEREELPDSLLTVLPLAARMPEEDAMPFRARFLRPAVEKMRKAVPAESNPYANLLAALAVLCGAGSVKEHPEGREHE